MAFNDFVQTELPLRPFAATDGTPGQVPVRSGNPLAARELVWVDPSSLGAGSSGVTNLSLTAAVNLSGHRAIAVASDGRAVYADNVAGNPAVVVGVTTGAAMVNTTATVQTSGKLSEPTWNWAPGAVYIGTNGNLTQTAPTVGFVLVIGTALSATELLIQKQNAIILI